MLQKLISFFTAIQMFFITFLNAAGIGGKYTFTVDASSLGADVPNMASNVNVWDMGTQFINAKNNTENDIYDFVEYVQLMQCTGGDASRDLFKNPNDFSVLDDYDFTRLIENCRGIINLGAKPHLKLGSVPLKYTADAEECVFSGNVYPPDDYNVYYNYIKAMAEALADEFGTDEVRSWRFGVMTEYENKDWFMAKSGDPLDTAKEYCKLYDYTVQALIDVLGDEIYVGAHSMTVTEGLWDEEIFICHCAKGVNYATGKPGSHIDYLSASFYDSSLGNFTSGKTLYETITYLKNAAGKYGLKDLKFGIDEGRILSGTPGRESSELLSRSTGYTWQAAYDARLYSQLWDAGGDYFSYWYYLSDGLMYGVPTVSYHTARLISQYKDSKAADVTLKKRGAISGAEVNLHAAFDEEENVLRAFAYNFKNTLEYYRTADITLDINAPQFDDGEVNVTLYRIDDNCNWFDEWQKDREKYGITDDCFSWSPDDGCVASMDNAEARAIYQNELKPQYMEFAKLTPETFTAEVKDGRLSINTKAEANTVVFFEITER